MTKARAYIRRLEAAERVELVPSRLSPEEYEAERAYDVLRFLMEEPPGPIYHGSDGPRPDSPETAPVRTIRRQKWAAKVA